MSQWEMVKLGEVCDVRDGTHDSPQYFETGVPLITSKNIVNGTIDFSDVNLISEEDFEKINKRSFVENGDILMPMIGTIGNPVIVTTNQLFAIKNVALIKFKNSKCDNTFVRYLLSSRLFLVYIKKENRGGTQKFLSLSNIRNFRFPLPPLETQQHMAKTLDLATEIIEGYRQKLTELDKLVQSVFYEMFGDPVLNPKEFPTELGKTLFNLSSGKPLLESERKQSGIPAYGGNGISWYTSKILCEIDTIVIGRVGFRSGNVHLVRKPLWVTDNAMYISSFYEKELNLFFLYSLMKYIDFTKLQDDGDLKKIKQKTIVEMNYIYPPIPLQEQFSQIVAKIEEEKALVEEGLREAEQLFGGLLQGYFED